MAQDGAAYNGQIRIGAYKVVGEHPNKVQQLFKGPAVDLHGNVPGVEHDAVFVIVNIGGVLQAPGLSAHVDGDDPVVGPGGMVHPTGIALVFHAQLALGVGILGGVLGGGNGLGVLFRLGQVDGDVHFAVGAVVLPQLKR